MIPLFTMSGGFLLVYIFIIANSICTRVSREACLKCEADEYIENSVLTQTERKALRGWVNDENSVYDNL